MDVVRLDVAAGQPERKSIIAADAAALLGNRSDSVRLDAAVGQPERKSVIAADAAALPGNRSDSVRLDAAVGPTIKRQSPQRKTRHARGRLRH